MNKNTCIASIVERQTPKKKRLKQICPLKDRYRQKTIECPRVDLFSKVKTHNFNLDLLLHCQFPYTYFTYKYFI